MGLLDEIARGGRVSGLDIARSGGQGAADAQQMRVSQQNLQMKAMQMAEYVEQRKRSKRLRASLKGADFGDYEATTKSAQIASDEGDYETALVLSRHAQTQKPKEGDDFGPMKPITINGKKIGFGQYDTEGKVHNLKTTKQIEEGTGGLDKPTKARTPTKNQIERGTTLVQKSDVFGEEDWGVGMSSKDNKALGRIVASRAQKLISDAKQLKQTLSDETAMDLALQELEDKKDTLIDQSDWVGISLKDDISDIFPSGISTTLQNYLGVEAHEAGIDMAAFTKHYNSLKSGESYTDPKGITRIKK